MLCSEFDRYMTSIGRANRAGGLEKARQNDFSNWLHTKVITNEIGDEALCRLAHRPRKRVMSYEGCEINGFRFYTQAHEQYRRRNNSGVCVRGETTCNTEHDYYGVVKEVIELTYDGIDNRVLLLKCHWFDIVHGVKIDHAHGIVEVKQNSTLRTDEPFVLACQGIQVYYLPYASDKRPQWSIAMKTRRKGKLIVGDAEMNDEFFQEEEPDCPISISIGQEFIWDNVLIQPNEYEEVNPDDISYRIPRSAEEIEEDVDAEEEEEEEEEEDELEEEEEELEIQPQQQDDLEDW